MLRVLFYQESITRHLQGEQNINCVLGALSAVNSSADEAMIDLLAGLENDGYQMGHHKTLSHHRSLGSCRNSQNSDDEENEPQCEKEEMELSLVMSQRWDSSIEEPGPKRRYICDLLFLMCSSLPHPFLLLSLSPYCSSSPHFQVC